MFLSQRQTETQSKLFTCKDSGLSQMFELIVSTSEKTLNNINYASKKTSLMGKDLKLPSAGQK